MNLLLKDTHQTANDHLHQENVYQQNSGNLITSKNDLENIKPFISLTRFTSRGKPQSSQQILTPASGKAIITYVVKGEARYSDSTGKYGRLKKDDWCRIISGSGMWYSIEPLTSDYVGIQLCIALSPALENSPPQSTYLDADPTALNDPAQVLMGWHGKGRSKFATPSLINYLVVHLKAGQRWSYEAPLNHQFAWAANVSGRVQTIGGDLHENNFTFFNKPTEKIEFHAQADAIFVLGSSPDFDHDLIFQNGSVHTSSEALHLGFKGITEARKAISI